MCLSATADAAIAYGLSLYSKPLPLTIPESEDAHLEVLLFVFVPLTSR